MSALGTLLTQSGVVIDRDANPTHLPDGTRVAYLHAGRISVAARPAQITTIVGSCVAICLWDPLNEVGGMNHYMLPDDVGSNTATPRYANFAIRSLIDQLQSVGADRQRLQAKIFGGAAVVSALSVSNGLGWKNVEVGLRRLREEQIPLVTQDVGGQHGRKIVFSTDTGATLVKRI